MTFSRNLKSNERQVIIYFVCQTDFITRQSVSLIFLESWQRKVLQKEGQAQASLDKRTNGAEDIRPVLQKITRREKHFPIKKSSTVILSFLWLTASVILFRSHWRLATNLIIYVPSQLRTLICFIQWKRPDQIFIKKNMILVNTADNHKQINHHHQPSIFLPWWKSRQFGNNSFCLNLHHFSFCCSKRY